jgi:hypothetical protein
MQRVRDRASQAMGLFARSCSSGCPAWQRRRNLWSRLFAWATGEVLLRHWPKCGTLILVRAIWSAAVVLILRLATLNVVEPDRTWDPSCRELRKQLAESLPSFATVLAAAYAAFYARFSSQWSYLAGVYNAIKAAEYSVAPIADRESAERQARALADWKAGFIEDCEDLHLARKPSFATSVYTWGRAADVQESFVSNVIGSRQRLESLLCIVAHALDREHVRVSISGDRPRASEDEPLRSSSRLDH